MHSSYCAFAFLPLGVLTLLLGITALYMIAAELMKRLFYARYTEATV